MVAAVRSSLDRIAGGRTAAQGCPPPNADLLIMQRSGGVAEGFRGRSAQAGLRGQGNSSPSSFVLDGGAGGDVPVQGPVGTPAVTVAPVLGCELVSALIITWLCS